MSSNSKQTYQIRWRGKVTGPFSLPTLQEMLLRNEVSLLHEAFAEDRWVSLEELLPKATAAPQPEEAVSASLEQSFEPPFAKSSSPPPLPPEELFYVAKSGRQEGPYNKNSVKQLVAGGLLSSDDLAWKEGMAEWMEIGRLMPGISRPAVPPVAPASARLSPPPPEKKSVEPLPPPKSAGVGGEVVGGYICAVLSLLFFPLVFAIAAFVCGIVALTKGKIGHGIAILVLSSIFCFIGMVIGAAVMSG
jgi:hypothetical protein